MVQRLLGVWLKGGDIVSNDFNEFVNSIPNIQEKAEGLEGEILMAIRELAGILAENSSTVIQHNYSQAELSAMEKDSQMRELAQSLLRY